MGVGKTVIAKRVGLHYGIPWLQVDDLRLALQSSHVTLPTNTEALYFFTETSDVWQLSSEQLCDSLITVGEAMSPAIKIVVASHVDTAVPIVIEGDGILVLVIVRTICNQSSSVPF